MQINKWLIYLKHILDGFHNIPLNHFTTEYTHKHLQMRAGIIKRRNSMNITEIQMAFFLHLIFYDIGFGVYGDTESNLIPHLFLDNLFALTCPPSIPG